MGTVKSETKLSEPEFHEATNIWRFNKGTNGIYRFVKIFYKVKPPDLSIEQVKTADESVRKNRFHKIILQLWIWNMFIKEINIQGPKGAVPNQ